MKSFELMFEEAGNNEIEYKGKKIFRFYKFERIGKFRLQFKFVGVNSPFGQGIVIGYDDYNGSIYINGQKLKTTRKVFRDIYMTEESNPNGFYVDINSDNGFITINNCSDSIGTGEFYDSLIEGRAMYIEQIGENKLRFYCNDHEIDDDFDDLIFDMEITESDSLEVVEVVS